MIMWHFHISLMITQPLRFEHLLASSHPLVAFHLETFSWLILVFWLQLFWEQLWSQNMILGLCLCLLFEVFWGLYFLFDPILILGNSIMSVHSSVCFDVHLFCSFDACDHYSWYLLIKATMA